MHYSQLYSNYFILGSCLSISVLNPQVIFKENFYKYSEKRRYHLSVAENCERDIQLLKFKGLLEISSQSLTFRSIDLF